MRFYRIDSRGAASDEGWAVELLGRSELRYTEGDRDLSVYVERRAVLIVHRDSIRRWEPPFHRDPLLEGKKAEIIGRVKTALDFLGEQYLLI